VAETKRRDERDAAVRVGDRLADQVLAGHAVNAVLSKHGGGLDQLRFDGLAFQQLTGNDVRSQWIVLPGRPAVEYKGWTEGFSGNPIPIPTTEGMTPAEQFPGIFPGRPTQPVWQIDTVSTPVPVENPDDYVFKSIRPSGNPDEGKAYWEIVATSASSTSLLNSEAVQAARFIESQWEQARAENPHLTGAGGSSTLHALTKARIHGATGDGVPEVIRDAIARGDLRAEVSFDAAGNTVGYGSSGSIRLDVYLRVADTVYIFDYKLGGATLTNARVDQIRTRAGNPQNVVVIEIK
jgi:hypothetical protein